jgi:hypothetical protein
MTEIVSALASLKTAFDIAKGISSLNVDFSVKEKTTELLDAIISAQSRMLALQSEYQSLLESKNELSKKIMEFEDWGRTESQYDLARIGQAIVRMPNNNHPTPSFKHYLCANCFDNKKKSILRILVPWEAFINAPRAGSKSVFSIRDNKK